MKEKEYNLLYERWLKVRYLDGRMDEIGLIDAFKEAHLIKALNGELPTQDLAIMRMMLAALYSIYLKVDAEGNERKIEDSDEAIEQWNEIWNKSCFKPELIEKYFEKYEDRFYLFHPERPFYQAPIKTGTYYSSAKLNGEISESNNKRRLFSPSCGVLKNNLTYSQAARWLIYTMAFDDASSKQKDKSNGSISIKTGWLGQIGPTYAEGNNLFETLMLNLVLVDENDEVMADGKPIWEFDAIRIKEREIIPLPDNQSELLTLQTRRILLARSEKDVVEGYTILGGDVTTAENALIEQMTSWKNDSKKNIYTPIRLKQDRSMWRDYSSILLRNNANTEGTKSPGVVNWIRTLHSCGHIPYSMLKLRVSGVTYDSKSSSVVSQIDDSLSVNIQLLSKLNDSWNNRISQSIATIDEGIMHLGNFLYDLLESEGNERNETSVKTRKENAKSEAYYRIDQPFRRWLASIDPTNDVIETSICKLYEVVRNILMNIGREMMNEASSAALIGKTRDNMSDKKYKNAFKSYNKFEDKIYKTFRSVAKDEC